jgi:hypothetical protein
MLTNASRCTLTIHKTPNPLPEPLIIKDAAPWIAQLGGFIGRKAKWRAWGLRPFGEACVA